VKNNFLITLGCLALSQTSSFAATSIWTAGADGNWTDATGWDTANYPGDTATADKADLRNNEVTVNSAIPNDLDEVYVRGNATLDVTTGGDLDINTNGNSILAIGDGIVAGGLAVAKVSGGDLTAQQYRIGRQSSGQLIISSGTANFTGNGGGNSLTFRQESAQSILDISGTGKFLQSGNSKTFMQSADSQINLAGMAMLDLSSGSDFIMDPNGGMAAFNITGAGATIDLNNLNSTDGGTLGMNLFNFVADASGVSPINIGGTLTVGDTSKINVDLSSYSGTPSPAFPLVLFTGVTEDNYNDFLNISSSRGSVIFDGGNIVVIPEPSRAMLGLFGMACVLYRRRR